MHSSNSCKLNTYESNSHEPNTYKPNIYNWCGKTPTPCSVAHRYPSYPRITTINNNHDALDTHTIFALAIDHSYSQSNKRGLPNGALAFFEVAMAMPTF